MPLPGAKSRIRSSEEARIKRRHANRSMIEADYYENLDALERERENRRISEENKRRVSSETKKRRNRVSTPRRRIPAAILQKRSSSSSNKKRRASPLTYKRVKSWDYLGERPWYENEKPDYNNNKTRSRSK